MKSIKTHSFTEDLIFDDQKPAIKAMFESPFSKEIRIAMQKGQKMKAHQTSFPIVVHVLRGTIDFGYKGVVKELTEGDIITLEGGISHSLFTHKESVIRLTLSKSDKAKRVVDVASENSDQ